MKIVPVENITFLRNTCIDNNRFPNPYDATDEQLRSVLYCAEVWQDDKGRYVHFDYNKEYIIVTFDEISKNFDEWDQTEEDYKYDTVYDWLRDCIDYGFHPVSIKE